VKHVTDPGLQVEFIIAMCNWMMFSLLFRNLRIPLAEGLMVWPPDGLAARWSGLPGGAGIGDRRSGCGHLLLSVIAAVDDESGAGYERCLLRTAHRATCLFPRLRASG